MKIHRTIKIALGSIFIAFLILFTLLIVHIVTAKPKVYDNATLQISRIDFQEPIDSIKAKEIHRNMKSIAGVKNPKFYREKNVLVYYHDIRVANSEQVFNQLMKKGDYKAQRLLIPAGVASKQVCPVMDESSFKYKFSRGVKSIFN